MRKAVHFNVRPQQKIVDPAPARGTTTRRVLASVRAGEGFLDRLAGGLGAFAEGVAGIASACADIAVTQRLAGSVEICPRMIGRGVAGGEANQSGEQDYRQPYIVHHRCNLRFSGWNSTSPPPGG